GLEKNLGNALYVNRTIAVKCLVDDMLMQPAADAAARFEWQPTRNKSLPRLAVDDDGGVWLLCRHRPGAANQGEVWTSSAVRYDGRAWSERRRLANSTNLMDNRPALTGVEGGVLAVYSSDTRNNTQGRGQDDLYTAYLAGETPVSQAPELMPDKPPLGTNLKTVHP